jgi:hypothetical protein
VDGDAFHRRELVAWLNEPADRKASAVVAVRAAAARLKRRLTLLKKILDRLIENGLMA